MILKIGDKIGRLTVLDIKKENKRTYYYCKCDCGNTKRVRQDMIGKYTFSCGCLNKETQFKSKDLTNKRFGRLIVLEQTKDRASNGSIIWKCKCDCGNVCCVSAKDLLSNSVTSCGCLFKETQSIRGKAIIKKLVDKNIVDGTNVPALERAINNKLIKSNKSGCTGVHWDKTRQKWAANITFQGRVIYLGRYKNKEDAIKVRKDAEEKYFKGFLTKEEK